MTAETLTPLVSLRVYINILRASNVDPALVIVLAKIADEIDAEAERNRPRTAREIEGDIAAAKRHRDGLHVIRNVARQMFGYRAREEAINSRMCGEIADVLTVGVDCIDPPPRSEVDVVQFMERHA